MKSTKQNIKSAIDRYTELKSELNIELLVDQSMFLKRLEQVELSKQWDDDFFIEIAEDAIIQGVERLY